MNAGKFLNQQREIIKEAQDKAMDYWTDNILFSWRWWIGIGMIVISISLWIIFRKKESTDRLLYIGFFVGIISSLFDMAGVYLGFWDYQYEVFPPLKLFVPWDIIVLPIIVMFLFQIKPKTNPLVKAIIYGLLTSFFALPLMSYIGFYKLLNWNYLYSLPIQIIIYMLTYLISKRSKFSSLKE